MTRYFDGQGHEQDEAWALKRFGPFSVTGGSDQYYLAEMREVAGPTSLTVTVRNRDGSPKEDVLVQFGWPDGEVEGQTDGGGAIGFGMGSGAWYKPQETAGPHHVIVDSVEVDGKRVGGLKVDGLGMLFGSDHIHQEPTFQEGDAPDPDPDPDPEPDENWAELFRLLNHIIALLEDFHA